MSLPKTMKCFKVPLNSVCDFMIPRVNLGAPQGPAGLAAQFGPLESRVIEDNSLRDPNPGCARANLGAADLIRGKGSVEMQSPTKRLLSPCRAAPTWEPCTCPCCRQPWLPQDPPPPPKSALGSVPSMGSQAPRAGDRVLWGGCSWGWQHLPSTWGPRGARALPSQSRSRRELERCRGQS